MKPVFIAVVMIALGAGLTTVAQNMVEYSNLATQSPVAQKALANKTGVSSGKSIVKTGSPANKAEADNQATPKPTPPAVFILSNGERLESSHYLLTAGTLKIEQAGVERTIPMSAINRNATEAANEQRGIDLKIPKDSGQITLSF